MVGDASAYAVLGVDPGSNSAEIEQAYRRLIKQHHPDREGGDASRAAEINRAYRELRSVRDLKDPLEFNLDWPTAPRSGRLWLLLAVLLALGTGALLWSQKAVVPATSSRPAATAHRPSVGNVRAAAPDDPMEQPLNVAAIDIAAADALRISRTRDEIELASKSRDCHRLLRTKPGLAQFDRCAGFDDAVASSRIAIRCAIKGQSASLPSPADCGAGRGSLTIRCRSTGGSIAFGCKWN